VKKSKLLGLGLVAVLIATLVSACSPGKLDVSNVTAIIDVRAEADFNTSHIVGAINNDFYEPGFSTRATSLIRSGVYYLYGDDEKQVIQAIEEMRLLGFANLTNLGSFEEAQQLLPLGVTN
jgi:rhodanese-related sulfurtransferase